MNEQQEVRVTEVPAWLDLPEKSEYWTCLGFDIPRVKRIPFLGKVEAYVPGWRPLFYTQEGAEADAVNINTVWKWDGTPAVRRTLSDAMRKARVNGDFGVQVKSFIGGKWVTVKQYPANEPLPESLRGETE